MTLEVTDGQRVAVVTGATSGIGEATVRIFARSGIRVVAVGRRGERLAKLEVELNTNKTCVHGFEGDVTREAFVSELFLACEQRWALNPDVFVLCAGIGLPGSVLRSDSTKWRDLAEVNYLAVLRQLRASALYMCERSDREGCRIVKDIVVVGSTIGRHVSRFNPVYGSTKFAMHSLVEALRQEVCSKNIRVTLVEPGFVKSEFQATAGYDMEWFRSIEEEMGPLLSPDDVARVVEFVVRQPTHVHVDDVRLRPTRQQV